MALDAMLHAPLSCRTQQRAVGTSQENRRRPLIDKEAGFNKHRLLFEQNKEELRGKGESQGSDVLGGMPTKASRLVSDLIKTHRITAIFKPGQ